MGSHMITILLQNFQQIFDALLPMHNEHDHVLINILVCSLTSQLYDPNMLITSQLCDPNAFIHLPMWLHNFP